MTILSENPASVKPALLDSYMIRAAMAIDDAEKNHKNLDRNGWARLARADRDGELMMVRLGSISPRNPFKLACVATAIAFIETGPVKRMKTCGLSSYEAKHFCESWGRDNGFQPYVANGDFLVAVFHTDVAQRRCSELNPNSILALKILDAPVAS
jgi:hypothetical protein